MLLLIVSKQVLPKKPAHPKQMLLLIPSRCYCSSQADATAHPKQVLLLLDLVRLGVVGAPLTIGGKLFEVTG